MFGGQLQRVDHPQHLVEIAAGRHRIDDQQLDLLVRSNDEHVAHGLIVGRGARARVARCGGRQHSVKLRDAQIRVADHRIVWRDALRLLDVDGPFGMIFDRIDAEPDQLDVTAVEFRLKLRDITEFGGANRRKILRVGEKDRPAVADPIMELDGSVRGFGFEIRGRVADL